MCNKATLKHYDAIETLGERCRAIGQLSQMAQVIVCHENELKTKYRLKCPKYIHL